MYNYGITDATKISGIRRTNLAGCATHSASMLNFRILCHFIDVSNELNLNSHHLVCLAPHSVV